MTRIARKLYHQMQIKVNMDVLSQLLHSSEPAVRYLALTRLAGRGATEPEILLQRSQIPSSPLVKALLAERRPDGSLPYHPYSKWRGAHWVLVCLADLDYPPGDQSLMPLLEQVYAWLLSKDHFKKIKTIEGRVRRCASQEGNALNAALALGLADERSHVLAERLIQWQWPDGGWNCDKKPEAINSSFMESLIPLRALSLHARTTGNIDSQEAAERAAEIFLKRELFKKRQDGSLISADFILLHYPCYWHYDILFALKVMAESGFITDPRCRPALELLAEKRLPEDGYAAEGKYYKATGKASTSRSLVDWSQYRLAGNPRANQLVTLDALYVLKSANIMW